MHLGAGPHVRCHGKGRKDRATPLTSLTASVRRRNVTRQTLRHTAAMSLLRAGVDTSVIALWLGHEDAETTQVYLHADMTIKEQGLARVRQALQATGPSQAGR